MNVTKLETNRPMRFLKRLDDSFLVQVLRELTRKSALLDLLLVNGEGLVGEVVARDGHLGRSDHEVVEFKIFGNRKKNCHQNLSPRPGESRIQTS